MTDNIRVAIVDDHPLFRQGVSQTLQAEPEMEVVGQGATAGEALQLAQELLPDIILLDIAMPGGGLNAVQSISVACPVIKIVMLTVSEEEDDVLAALKAGARAYILKGVSARELTDILRSVYLGEVYVTPTLAASLLREMTATSLKPEIHTNPMNDLTEREQEVLQLVAAGFSNKEVGQRIHLTEKTVKHYMTNILQKLQVRNRVQAALLVQKMTEPQPKA